MLKQVLLSLLFTVCLLYSAERGYGDWLEESPGFPDMKDRRVLLLTNSCRLDPTGYRDEYLGDYDILLPENYPTVDPLYWQIDLNRVARIHSEDMAQNGLSHSSSDGTSFGDRVKSYYSKSGWIAENIAAGNIDAISTVWQWLMDITDYSTQEPAEDNSLDDGHRRNIMSSTYKEMGSGYAYGPAKYNHFWTQDFGGGTPDYTNPISAAAHFIGNDSVTFLATYKDPYEGDPIGAFLWVEGEKINLSTFLGNTNAGTYRAMLPLVDSCRNYFFEFIDSEGNSCRHPEGGALVTIGDGDCIDQYSEPEDVPILGLNKKNDVKLNSIIILNKKMIFDSMHEISNLSVYNISGANVFKAKIKNGQKELNLSNLTSGYYVVKFQFLNKSIGHTKFYLD